MTTQNVLQVRMDTATPQTDTQTQQSPQGHTSTTQDPIPMETTPNAIPWAPGFWNIQEQTETATIESHPIAQELQIYTVLEDGQMVIGDTNTQELYRGTPDGTMGTIQPPTPVSPESTIQFDTNGTVAYLSPNKHLAMFVDTQNTVRTATTKAVYSFDTNTEGTIAFRDETTYTLIDKEGTTKTFSPLTHPHPLENIYSTALSENGTLITTTNDLTQPHGIIVRTPDQQVVYIHPKTTLDTPLVNPQLGPNNRILTHTTAGELVVIDMNASASYIHVDAKGYAIHQAIYGHNGSIIYTRPNGTVIFLHPGGGVQEVSSTDGKGFIPLQHLTDHTTIGITQFASEHTSHELRRIRLHDTAAMQTTEWEVVDNLTTQL